MPRKLLLSYLLVTVVFVLNTNAQTNTFTYQGRLTDGATAASGTYEMQFSVYSTPSGAGQIGSTITNSSVTVTAGVFTVTLDFSPATPFASGADRWIEIAVRRPADPPGFTTLTPRQKVLSSPYSIRSTSASSADNVSGIVSIANGGTGSATQNFVDLTTDQTVGGNKTFTGNIAGNGSGLTNLNGANITSNTIAASALASDTFPNSQNLSRLGQLRWDLLSQRVAAGAGASGVAFDGTNIWVANQNGSNVTKLRASDGACAGVVGPPTAACTFAVGSTPSGIIFDGANMWVANFSSNSVTKLRASDGALQGTFTTGLGANGVAFDGANIWVANTNGNTVTKLRASDGACAGVVGPPTAACTFAAGTNPFGIAFDGANIWVTNNNTTNVTKLRASDGSLVGTFTVGSSPQAVAFDGSNVWVTNNSSSNVTKLRASDGACIATCTFAVGAGPYGVAFDGAAIWIASSVPNSVTRVRASDGTVLGSFVVGTTPRGVAFDGANIWVTHSGSSNVIKLPVFP